MAKKTLFVVFTLECVVLALLLCGKWTLYYISGGRAENDYQSVYRDKIDAGHHPVTAEIDAGTASVLVWWTGTWVILFGVGVGGPRWAYQQLWPGRTARTNRADRTELARGVTDRRHPRRRPSAAVGDFSAGDCDAADAM